MTARGRSVAFVSRRRIAVATAAFVSLIVIVLLWHQVDTSVSVDDRRSIPQYLTGTVPIPPVSSRSYSDEVAFIAYVQRAVLRVAPRNEGLPFGSGREPRDLLEVHRGLCYDRSRVIEKILRYADIETRHISLYSTQATGSALESLLTPGVPSHAVTEARTRRGWLVVDSNAPWISLNVDNEPVSMTVIEAAADGGPRPRWKQSPPNPIYERPFTFVYGLYSRHGRFYPPYDPIPDVNYGELIQNVW